MPDEPSASDDPSDADLVDFARLLIGDVKPYLDVDGLEAAIGRHRELWVKLYRVDAGLEELEAPPSDPAKPIRPLDR